MPKGHIQSYYEKQGLGIEGIIRCEGCRKLVVLRKLNPQVGCRNCGSKRFNDVKSLSGWEFFLIRIGWTNFPDRDKFIKEFRRV